MRIPRLLEWCLLGVPLVHAGCGTVSPPVGSATDPADGLASTPSAENQVVPAHPSVGGAQRFLAHFNPAAQAAFERVTAGGTMEGLRPRLVASSLAECYTDSTELAHACFRALGEGFTQWHEDNGLTGAAQTAVEELGVEVFVRVLESVHDDELALRGAARVYFRFQLASRLTPAARAHWTVRLAECVMRRGYPADQALVLHALASIDDPNINRFLHETALGQRNFPEDTRQPVADVRSFEPSWSCGAALILAERGDPQAARLVRRLGRTHRSESDVLALALARAALDVRAPFPTQAFTAYSFLLGCTGIDLMERRATNVPPAVLVAAASARLDPVATAARAAIRRLGLNLTIDNRPLAEVA